MTILISEIVYYICVEPGSYLSILSEIGIIAPKIFLVGRASRTIHMGLSTNVMLHIAPCPDMPGYSHSSS